MPSPALSLRWSSTQSLFSVDPGTLVLSIREIPGFRTGNYVFQRKGVRFAGGSQVNGEHRARSHVSAIRLQEAQF